MGGDGDSAGGGGHGHDMSERVTSAVSSDGVRSCPCPCTVHARSNVQTGAGGGSSGGDTSTTTAVCVSVIDPAWVAVARPVSSWEWDSRMACQRPCDAMRARSACE